MSTRPEQNRDKSKVGLILLRLDRNKAHAWARDGFTDYCRIGGIVLRVASAKGFA
jgi:hypothetical protein